MAGHELHTHTQHTYANKQNRENLFRKINKPHDQCHGKGCKQIIASNHCSPAPAHIRTRGGKEVKTTNKIPTTNDVVCENRTKITCNFE